MGNKKKQKRFEAIEKNHEQLMGSLEGGLRQKNRMLDIVRKVIDALN